MGKSIKEVLQLATFKKINFGIYNDLDQDEQEIYRQKLIRDLDNDIQAKVLMECIQQRYKQHFNRLLDEVNTDTDLPLIKEINDYNAEKENERIKSDYVFITVNPREGIKLNDFTKVVSKSVEKSFIKTKTATRVFGQRSLNARERGDIQPDE